MLLITYTLKIITIKTLNYKKELFKMKSKKKKKKGFIPDFKMKFYK